MVVKGTSVTFTTKTDERQRRSLTPLVIITNRKVSPLIIIIITLMLMMIIIIMMMSLKRAFKWASPRANLTIQPTTVLDRLTVGCYLTLIMGAIDAE